MRRSPALALVPVGGEGVKPVLTRASVLRTLGYALASGGDLDQAKEQWEEALASLGPLLSGSAASEAEPLAVELLLLLDRPEAAERALRLLDAGYREPRFARLAAERGVLR